MSEDFTLAVILLTFKNPATLGPNQLRKGKR